MDLLKYVLVMNITLKVDEQKINEMLDFYSNNIVPNNGEYIYFFAKIDHKITNTKSFLTIITKRCFGIII